MYYFRLDLYRKGDFMNRKEMRSTKSIQIEELLHLADRTFDVKEGAYLYREGMKAEELYIILSGKVRVSKVSSEGRMLTLRLCGENEMCGELTLFTEAPRYLLSAKVTDDARIVAIKKDVLEAEMFNNTKLAFEFMKYMSDHIRKTHTKFRDLVLIGRRGALISTLIRMSNSFGIEKEDGIFIDLPLTNQELADFCAISRESANKILNDLKREGSITNHKGYITILDLETLREEIGCENCSDIYCSLE